MAGSACAGAAFGEAQHDLRRPRSWGLDQVRVLGQNCPSAGTGRVASRSGLGYNDDRQRGYVGRLRRDGPRASRKPDDQRRNAHVPDCLTWDVARRSTTAEREHGRQQQVGAAAEFAGQVREDAIGERSDSAAPARYVRTIESRTTFAGQVRRSRLAVMKKMPPQRGACVPAIGIQPSIDPARNNSAAHTAAITRRRRTVQSEPLPNVDGG